MVCEHCGAVAREGELVCQQCGAMLPVRDMGSGAAAIRQGRENAGAKKNRVGSGVPDTRAPVTQVLDEENRYHPMKSRSEDNIAAHGRLAASRIGR